MPKILVMSGEKKGFVFRLGHQDVFIGRAPINNIILPDRRVSRDHACIIKEGDRFVLVDRGSVNGTWVNNNLIEKYALQYGDEIKLGSTILKFLSLGANETTDAAQPCSQVHLIKTDLPAKGFTVELAISSDQAARLSSEEIFKGDPQALQKAYQRLQVLYKISHDLVQIIDLKALLDEILDFVINIVKADRGFILLMDEETRGMVPQAVRARQGMVLGEQMAISQTIIKHILETGNSVLTSDVRTDDRFQQAESIVLHDIRSAMCVPIKVKDSIVGILSVDTKSKQVCFSKDDLELVTTICDQAAIAIENARLFEGLKKANEELKNQQKQLIEAEKLSAIGKLASGVAHEINNPLTSILGYSELSYQQLSKEQVSEGEKKECVEFMKIVNEEGHHCKRIAQTLLQFSRRKNEQMAPLNVNEAIEAALLIAKFHIKKVSIEIKKNLKENLPLVLGDTNQLQQVFLNLIINARDAMEEGGQLTILSHESKDQGVIIKFSDTGCGIPPENLEEIFKPLFTTKEEGKGTGLGLSISQDIIDQHKGSIEVESTVGKGTTFIIKLPGMKQS